MESSAKVINMFEHSNKKSPSSFKVLLETDEEKIARLSLENQKLLSDLSLERKYRYDAEQRVKELENELKLANMKRKRRTKAEINAEETVPYSAYKTNGVKKASPAQSIRSYEDFKAIQNYFEQSGKMRDWAFWTIGVSLGLRVSDLVNIKIRDVMNEDYTYKDRIRVIEQKTNKANNCLITESVKNACDKYFKSINYSFSFDDYLFKSNKTGSKLREEYGWTILSNAGKALNLPVNIGSHTMRKSFANIAACVDKSVVDMNTVAKVQGLLNHSDQRVTMKYLDTFQTMYDKARIAVSDFVLGKTDIHELVAGNSHSIDDVFTKILELEGILKEG